jgi:hypothetical protein
MTLCYAQHFLRFIKWTYIHTCICAWMYVHTYMHKECQAKWALEYIFVSQAC